MNHKLQLDICCRQVLVCTEVLAQAGSGGTLLGQAQLKCYNCGAEVQHSGLCHSPTQGEQQQWQ